MPTPSDCPEIALPDRSTEVQAILPPASILKLMAATAVLLFVCSSLRHLMFQSTGFDLGIYDQVTYLISQGQPPISSILGFHHLGNHGAWSVYPLALFYKLFPTVYWLLGIQAIALSLGAWPVWGLVRQAELSPSLAKAVAIIYLLYPVIFNVNLFDFHPEVMALPALLAAILAARRGNVLGFSLAILWVLGCKAVLSLTVTALGFWLLFFERRVAKNRRICGLIGLAMGVSWFIVVTQVMIPSFSGEEAAGVWRYTYLGDSVLEILLNFFLKPQLVWGRLFMMPTLDYLYKLSLPVIWWLSPQALMPLIPAIPTLVINSLSEVPFQRSLAFQYSIPVIPFLLLAVIESFHRSSQNLSNWTLGSAARQLWQRMQSQPSDKPQNIFQALMAQTLIARWRLPQYVMLWSLLIFLVYGKYGHFWVYLNRLDNWSALRSAVIQVQPQGSVLTDNRLAPHFTHRPNVKLLSQVTLESDLAEFDYIVLNLRHPWPDTQELGTSLAQNLSRPNSPNALSFQTIYEQDDVLVFQNGS
ncbi:MAG: DUF2079 domain-containing protein [Microcoleaceae cyanobacterium]